MRAAIAGALALLSSAAGFGAEAVSFVGATVYPVSAPPIENAVLTVADGLIVSLESGGPPPEGSRVVNLRGKRLYPGFVHPSSALGLVEISSVRGTVDNREIGEILPDLSAEVAFHADSELLPVAMSGGVLTAHVVPRGGFVRGRSAVMSLAGWNWREMALRAPAAMHLALPPFHPAADSPSPLQRKETEAEKKRVLAAIDELFGAARGYGRALAAAERGEAPPPFRDSRLEALQPVLSGDLPLFLHAREYSQIAHAIEWVRDQQLERFVLVSGPDLARHAERLGAEDVAVVLDGVLDLPPRPWEPYDTAFTAARRLHEAGVRFAIGDGGGAANARNLPFEAAMAAAFGLPREVALRSVTLTPAELLGVEDRVGSLEPGKDATFFVCDGDPLEILTRIERAFVRGQEVDPERDRQRRLYERYRERPRLPPSR